MKIVQFTGAKILTTAGPSITMHSTEGLLVRYHPKRTKDLIYYQYSTCHLLIKMEETFGFHSWKTRQGYHLKPCKQDRVVKKVDHFSSWLQSVIDVLHFSLFSRSLASWKQRKVQNINHRLQCWRNIRSR